MKAKHLRIAAKLVIFSMLTGTLVFLGISAPSSNLQSNEALAWPWSAYARVQVRVGPMDVGAHAYVYLYDGNGKYYGCLKTPGTWGGNLVNYYNVYVDKPLTIYVRWQTGELKRYVRPGGRPWGDTRIITINYFTGASG